MRRSIACVLFSLALLCGADPARSAETTITLDPNDQKAAETLGWQLAMLAAADAFEKGEYAKASEFYQQAVEYAPLPVQKYQALIELTRSKLAEQKWREAADNAQTAYDVVTENAPTEIQARLTAVELKLRACGELQDLDEMRRLNALAQTLTAGSQAEVWKTGENGTAIHEKTGWQCPATLNGMTRAKTNVFRPDSTDVGCTYVLHGAGFAKLDIYLTLLPADLEMSAYYAGARDDIALYTQNATPIVETQPLAMGSGTLRHAMYRFPDQSGNEVHSGIWLVDIGPWALKARMTFDLEFGDARAREVVMTFLRNSQATLEDDLIPGTEPGGIP